MMMNRRRCDLCEDNFYCRDIDCMSVDNCDSVARRVLQIRIMSSRDPTAHVDGA